MTTRTATNIAFLIALIGTGLALGGALAHLYELPNKIGIQREHYLIVQRNYDGWWQLAYVLAIQLVGILALLVLTRNEPATFWRVVVALIGLVGAQVVFWMYTQPANAATQNWTMLPDNWERLRSHWEWSHASGAIFQIVAFVALVIAVVWRAR